MASDREQPPGEIVDPAAMRALAHPLKWALMEVLLVEGAATSTRCAELVGESQANCSFHLRQLARYGLVEEAPTSSKKERPWRLSTVEQSWRQVQPDENRARAAAELERLWEVMLTYRDRLTDPSQRPEGSRPVRLFAVGYPLPEFNDS
jgi:hypothetical protein